MLTEEMIKTVFMKKANSFNLNNSKKWCPIGFGPIVVTNAGDNEAFVLIYDTNAAKDMRQADMFKSKPICEETLDADKWQYQLWEKHSDLICKEFNKWFKKFGNR